MPRLFIAISFIAALLGCATTSRLDSRLERKKSPPSDSFINKWNNAKAEDLERLAVGQQENEIRWWKLYKIAQIKNTTEPEIACQHFSSLSREAEFPLKDLALLRAHDICKNHDQLPPFPSSVAPWYRDLFVEIRLKEFLNSPDPTDELDALIEKAQLESNKKNKEGLILRALNLARRLQVQNKTEELEAALYKNSPRLITDPKNEELLSVALDFRFHREFEKAIATYKKLLADKEASPEDQYQALKNIRQTLKVAQRRQEYINATADLVNWSKRQFQKNKKDRKALVRFYESQVLLAKTLWTEDQTTQAIKTLNETDRLLRGSYPMDEVYFILGRIEEEKGNFTKAIEYFEASYKESITVPGLRDKIAWLKSWNYYKLAQYESAKSSFEQMKELVKDPTDKARASFWLARCLMKLEKPNEAEQELNRLIQEDPLGYYGILAVRELRQDFQPFVNDANTISALKLFNVGDIDPQIRITAEWLITLNERGPAEKILNYASDDLKKRSINKSETWLAIASAYARTGLYLPLFATITSLPSELKDRLLKQHPDLLFPQPFRDIIAEASQKSGTPMEFIYSIIRQESAFNPEARSAADAFGLMQLLPSIAQQLAKQNSIAYTEPSDLYKPEVNIALGAFELKSLMNKYKNQFILAVSGYNANDSAIRGWLNSRFRTDPVEFIEEVPYEETRTYIKLVLRNYVFYQRLLNKGSSIPFPEKLLAFSK